MKTLAARRLLTASVAACGLVTGLLGIWWLRRQGYAPHQMIEGALEMVRGLGPAGFFTAMAVVPALGVPLTVFTFTAGSAFVATLGMPLTLALSFLGVGVNLTFTYAIARWLMRPLVERFCGWLGFAIPQVPRREQVGLMILLRVTPGPPFFVQNYLCGIARIHLGVYLVTSWLLGAIDATLYIVFGHAVVEGHAKLALTGFGVMVALIFGTRWLRRWLMARKTKDPRAAGSPASGPGHNPETPGNT